MLEKCRLHLSAVRLLRHQQPDATPARSVWNLWLHDRPAFERYQAEQSPAVRSKLTGTHWAAFIVNSRFQTIFVGLYKVTRRGPNPSVVIAETTGELHPPGTRDLYDLVPDSSLAHYSERIEIYWGSGTRSWIQRADRQAMTILEIRKARGDDPFPGYSDFISTLSALPTLPPAWIEVLSAARGVYALTCPRTNELYIGAATGPYGFYGRWITEAADGHGGNIRLRERDRSDYQVTILEVVGGAVTEQQIWARESIWKRKLQTRAMGMNAN